jgi:hypothetical protein
LAAPFPLDLIVRTPKEMKWRLEEGESFLTTIMSKGKILYEKDDEGVGQESRSPASPLPTVAEPAYSTGVEWKCGACAFP